MTIFEQIADRKIREAMQEGQFDDLSNHGRPIDLEAYFAVPVELRAALHLALERARQR
jgi:Domain of unknown function (DUF1992)